MGRLVQRKSSLQKALKADQITLLNQEEAVIQLPPLPEKDKTSKRDKPRISIIDSVQCVKLKEYAKKKKMLLLV